MNRSLISVKRYFAWRLRTGYLKYDPAKVVRLVGEEVSSPRHLDDQEEQALLAAVIETGSVRDRAMIVLLLHKGLRAQELCTLTRAQVRPGKRNRAHCLEMNGISKTMSQEEVHPWLIAPVNNLTTTASCTC